MNKKETYNESNLVTISECNAGDYKLKDQSMPLNRTD